MNLCPTCGRDKDIYIECGCETHALIKVDYPEDGFGIFSYVESFKYPMNMLIDGSIHNSVSVFKRAVISVLRYFPFTILFRKRFENWLRQYYYVLFHQTVLFNWDVKRFCRSGREIYRVLSGLIGDEFARMVCLVYEWDSAYRFPLQDVLSLLNKNNSARFEVNRLLKILDERELLVDPTNPNNFTRKRKWAWVKRMFNVVWFVSPKFRKLVRNFISEVNVEALQYDTNDLYWTDFRFDFNYRGLTYEERIKEFYKINEGFDRSSKPISAKIALVPNDEFLKLSEEQAKRECNNLVANFMGEGFMRLKKAKGFA